MLLLLLLLLHLHLHLMLRLHLLLLLTSHLHISKGALLAKAKHNKASIAGEGDEWFEQAQKQLKQAIEKFGASQAAEIEHTGGPSAESAQVREHSSAVERCGPHVYISPAMLRSSNVDRERSGGARRAAGGGRAARCDCGLQPQGECRSPAYA